MLCCLTIFYYLIVFSPNHLCSSMCLYFYQLVLQLLNLTSSSLSFLFSRTSSAVYVTCQFDTSFSFSYFCLLPAQDDFDPPGYEYQFAVHSFLHTLLQFLVAPLLFLAPNRRERDLVSYCMRFVISHFSSRQTPSLSQFYQFVFLYLSLFFSHFLLDGSAQTSGVIRWEGSVSSF